MVNNQSVEGYYINEGGKMMKKLLLTLLVGLIFLAGCSGGKGTDAVDRAKQELDKQKSYSGILLLSENTDIGDIKPISTTTEVNFQVIRDQRLSHKRLEKTTTGLDVPEELKKGENYEVYTEVNSEDSNKLNLYTLESENWKKENRPIEITNTEETWKDIFFDEGKIWSTIVKNKDQFKDQEEMTIEGKELLSLKGVIDETEYNILINKKNNLPEQISWKMKEETEKTENKTKTISRGGILNYQEYDNVQSIEIPQEAKK